MGKFHIHKAKFFLSLNTNKYYYKELFERVEQLWLLFIFVSLFLLFLYYY